MKTSGFYNCLSEIMDAKLPKPIVYPSFTVYFDSNRLDEIKSKYGAELFKECYKYVRMEA